MSPSDLSNIHIPILEHGEFRCSTSHYYFSDKINKLKLMSEKEDSALYICNICKRIHKVTFYLLVLRDLARLKMRFRKYNRRTPFPVMVLHEHYERR